MSRRPPLPHASASTSRTPIATTALARNDGLRSRCANPISPCLSRVGMVVTDLRGAMTLRTSRLCSMCMEERTPTLHRSHSGPSSLTIDVCGGLVAMGAREPPLVRGERACGTHLQLALQELEERPETQPPRGRAVQQKLKELKVGAAFGGKPPGGPRPGRTRTPPRPGSPISGRSLGGFGDNFSDRAASWKCRAAQPEDSPPREPPQCRRIRSPRCRARRPRLGPPRPRP